QIPGRLRLRVPSDAGESFADTLRAAPGVRSVVWSPRTRGLLVLFDPDSTSAPAILEVLGERAGFDDAPAQRGEGQPHEAPAVTAAVVGTVSEIDRRVRRSTAGALGLGTLVPAALALWAAGEIARGRVVPLSWSSALWYAHGLFRDYNSP